MPQSSDEEEGPPKAASLMSNMVGAFRARPKQYEDDGLGPLETDFERSSGGPIIGSKKQKSQLRTMKRTKQAAITKAVNRKREEQDAAFAAAQRKAQEEEAARLAQMEEARKAREAAEEEEKRQKKADRKYLAKLRKIRDVFKPNSDITLAAFFRYLFPVRKKLQNGEQNKGPRQNPLLEEDDVGNDYRWKQFFIDETAMPDLLDFFASASTPITRRAQLTEFAIQHVEKILRSEAQKVTESELLWARGKQVDDDFITGLNYNTLHDRFRDELAPTSIRLLKHIATSRQQEKKMSSVMQHRKTTVSGRASPKAIETHPPTN